MAYKKGKDKVIGMTQPPMETNIDGQGQRIVVGVFQYAESPAKIGIQRSILNGGEPRPSKLGRLTAEEAEYIARQLPKAVEILKRHTGE
jgi:hypothetical protein